MEVKFAYSEICDLVFHFLAHMRVENASDLFSQNYIDRIQSVKSNSKFDVVQEAALLAPYYNENFERVGMINFLPYSCTDFPSFKDLLLRCDTFSQEDKEQLIIPLMHCLELEDKFYSNYWERLFHATYNKRLIAEEYVTNALQKYCCLFEYFKKDSAVVYYSFSLTRNGRGIGNENSTILTATIPYPTTEIEYKKAFFTLLHEFTHQFTDPLLATDINMKDGSHDLSEKVVILFDYYLIEALDKSDIASYFIWLAQNSGNENITIDNTQFLSIFKIPDSLNSVLISMINNIISR